MDYKLGREKYTYPCVGLAIDAGVRNPIRFSTTLKLDEYHRKLLRSEADNALLLGFLSVLYWGHYSGAAGIVKSNRAMSKTTLALNGKGYLRKGRPQRIRGLIDFKPGGAVAVLRQAASEIEKGNFGDAIKTLCALPQIQFAFASKLAAFMAPEKCGVIDSVIVKNNPDLGFYLRGGYISNVKGNFPLYQHYCERLQSIAESLNAQGDAERWLDLDGTSNAWRAIDVERAMYSQKAVNAAL
ncbi:hypothetical protein [Pseudomonas sp. TMW 2.1634]|uniref:hypothetical protein n=1 Tax=Pseudomonas sp. TMW 2.1634 TaxID=1886807 RepID=UPI000E74D4FE|nr:hypothetical protein [Pseudomonas sp. TMW 2.1634]AOA06163.1 hypothetical protein BFC21_10335 [Pseudomonas sp. TMW 2.1634]